MARHIGEWVAPVHLDGDGHGDAAGGDSDVPLAVCGARGETALRVDGTHGGVGGPDNVTRVHGHGQVVPDAGGGQLHLLPRLQDQGIYLGGGILPGDVEGGQPVHHLHRQGKALACGNRIAARKESRSVHRAAAAAGEESAGGAPAEDLAGEGPPGAVVWGSGDIQAGPRQHHPALGGDVSAGCEQRLARPADQGDGVIDLSVVGGGPVYHLKATAAGQGGPQGGGAAAVQGHGGHAAQFLEPLGHLGVGGAHRVASLAAVNGVKDRRAVALEAHGGVGVGGGGQAVYDLPIPQQGVQAADAVYSLIPLLAGAAQHHGHLHTGNQLPQGGEELRIAPVLGIKHVAALGKNAVENGLVLNGVGDRHHLQGEGAVHFHLLPVHRPQDGGHAGPAAGDLGGEVLVIEIELVQIVVVAVGVKPGDGEHPLYAVITRPGGGDGGLALVDKHPPVAGEAQQGVVGHVQGADHPVGHEHAHNGAVRVEKAAVDGGYHPPALGFQLGGGGLHGVGAGHIGAAEHHGDYGGVWGVCNVMFRAQVLLGCGP